MRLAYKGKMNTNLTFDEIKSLIELITNKGLLDYISLSFNLLTSVAIVFITWYMFVKTPKQNKVIKIQEKEIELLYSAFDNFFIFSDAISLYISNKERKLKKLALNEIIQEPFIIKENISSDNVYSSFSKFFLAKHTLQAIGDIKTINLFDNYRSKSVFLRENIYKFEKINNPTIEQYKEIISTIESERKEIEKIKVMSFKSISQFKDSLKK